MSGARGLGTCGCGEQGAEEGSGGGLAGGGDPSGGGSPWAALNVAGSEEPPELVGGGVRVGARLDSTSVHVLGAVNQHPISFLLSSKREEDPLLAALVDL